MKLARGGFRRHDMGCSLDHRHQSLKLVIVIQGECLALFVIVPFL